MWGHQPSLNDTTHLLNVCGLLALLELPARASKSGKPITIIQGYCHAARLGPLEGDQGRKQESC